MGKLVVKLTFAGTIFVVSQWLAIHLVDFIVWFLDADKTGIYQKNQKTFDLVYDVVIPYFVGEFIKYSITFVILTWGWTIARYMWDFFMK